MAHRPPLTEDDGFTLIELMVVVLIIAILIAVAIPTFLGARSRANDRAAQTNLRNGLENELVIYSDGVGFTEDIPTLVASDSSLTYGQALATLNTASHIYVNVTDTYATNDTVVLGTRSKTGSCFWLRNIGDKDFPRFATNDCAAEPTTYTDSW